MIDFNQRTCNSDDDCFPCRGEVSSCDETIFTDNMDNTLNFCSTPGTTTTGVRIVRAGCSIFETMGEKTLISVIYLFNFSLVLATLTVPPILYVWMAVVLLSR